MDTVRGVIYGAVSMSASQGSCRVQRVVERAGDDGGWAPQSPLGPSPDRHQFPGPPSISKPPAATSRASVDTLGSYDSHNPFDRRRVRHRRQARLPEPREAAARPRHHRRCEIRPSGRRDAASSRSSVSSPSVIRSPQFGDRRRSRPRGPARLSQSWHCESATRAGGRAEAVVPRLGRARLDGAIATARSTVLAAVDGASDAYARPGRRRSAAHLRFRLGRRAAVVARDRADKASGCRRGTTRAPAAQPALAGRAGLPLTRGAPARRRPQRSSAPRPLGKPAAASRRLCISSRRLGGARNSAIAGGHDHSVDAATATVRSNRAPAGNRGDRGARERSRGARPVRALVTARLVMSIRLAACGSNGAYLA
jgi:hypothetical protein